MKKLILRVAEDAVKIETDRMARDVKDDVLERITNASNAINKDIEYKEKLFNNRLDLIELKNTNLIKEVNIAIKNQNKELEKIEKAIEFLQQFYWGKEAKSLPPFTLGLDETEEHAKAEGEGLFRPTEEEDVSKGIFRCDDCHKGFKSRKLLNAHIVKQHVDKYSKTPNEDIGDTNISGHGEDRHGEDRHGEDRQDVSSLSNNDSK